MRFDPSFVTLKGSLIFSQIVSPPSVVGVERGRGGGGKGRELQLFFLAWARINVGLSIGIGVTSPPSLSLLWCDLSSLSGAKKPASWPFFHSTGCRFC